jgi:hypothetical protein
MRGRRRMRRLCKLREQRRAGWYVGDSGEGRKGDNPLHRPHPGFISWQRYVVACSYPPRIGNYRTVFTLSGQSAAGRSELDS